MAEKSGGWAGIFVSLLLVAVGVGVSMWGSHIKELAAASENWPTAEGRITASEVTSHRNTDTDRDYYYSAHVEYAYTVNGTRYSSDAVTVGDYSTTGPGDAQRIVDRYPVNKTVSVRYDPEDPGMAILEPGAAGIGNHLFWVGFVFAGAGLLVGLLCAVSLATSFVKGA